MDMLILGVIFGVACALAHAFSYLFTRSFVKVPGRKPVELLALGHILMAGISLVLLPFVWMTPTAGWSAVFWPLMGATGFYLAAQGAFFVTLRHMTASRASPLLGIKLVFVALFGTLFFGAVLRPTQWLAVGVAVVAGLLLNRAGARLSLRAVFWLVLSCIGYSLSDLNIQRLIVAMDPGGSMQATIFSVVVEYSVCGLYGLLLFARLGGIPFAAWKRALPFALSWYAAMCFLYMAISTLGVVLAIILQSLRGLLSIGLGILIVRWGMLHLEDEVSRMDRLRQAGAALLMIAAIGLYVAGR